MGVSSRVVSCVLLCSLLLYFSPSHSKESPDVLRLPPSWLRDDFTLLCHMSHILTILAQSDQKGAQMFEGNWGFDFGLVPTYKWHCRVRSKSSSFTDVTVAPNLTMPSPPKSASGTRRKTWAYIVDSSLLHGVAYGIVFDILILCDIVITLYSEVWKGLLNKSVYFLITLLPP